MMTKQELEILHNSADTQDTLSEIAIRAIQGGDDYSFRLNEFQYRVISYIADQFFLESYEVIHNDGRGKLYLIEAIDRAEAKHLIATR